MAAIYLKFSLVLINITFKPTVDSLVWLSIKLSSLPFISFLLFGNENPFATIAYAWELLIIFRLNGVAN